MLHCGLTSLPHIPRTTTTTSPAYFILVAREDTELWEVLTRAGRRVSCLFLYMLTCTRTWYAYDTALYGFPSCAYSFQFKPNSLFHCIQCRPTSKEAMVHRWFITKGALMRELDDLITRDGGTTGSKMQDTGRGYSSSPPSQFAAGGMKGSPRGRAGSPAAAAGGGGGGGANKVRASGSKKSNKRAADAGESTPSGSTVEDGAAKRSKPSADDSAGGGGGSDVE